MVGVGEDSRSYNSLAYRIRFAMIMKNGHAIKSAVNGFLKDFDARLFLFFLMSFSAPSNGGGSEPEKICHKLQLRSGARQTSQPRTINCHRRSSSSSSSNTTSEREPMRIPQIPGLATMQRKVKETGRWRKLQKLLQ